MTRFECSIDPAEFEESWASHREVLNSEVTVEHTGFYALVTLVHNGRNLFRVGTNDFANIPLVGFVRLARDKIARIRSGEEALITMGCSGTMRLQREGSQVWVSITRGGAPVAVDHQELMEATLRFADEVRALIAERVPEFRRHPSWSVWFPPIAS
jgi:hypothetical protein